MTAAAMLALREAVTAALRADAALAALMGGEARIHDEPPRAARHVYAVLGEASARDWSADGAPGHQHAFTITVWSVEGSARPALAAAARIAQALDDAPLALAGHRLVTLRPAAAETARDRATGRVRVALRFTALTETD